MRTVNVTRYIQPLREGGSLPALTEADDGFKYVLKFKGTGHGEKSLIAELIGGEVARLLGFRIPELVLANLDEAFGRTEGDEEIQDLLKASIGVNIGLHFLSGAITFDPVVTEVDSALASGIVWLDAYLTNIDRTFRNTNMLLWNKEIWLIDHGSCLSFQYNWTDLDQKAKSPFNYIKEHVLLKNAAKLDETDRDFRSKLSPEKLAGIINMIPDEWLKWRDTTEEPQALKKQYLDFLITRLNHSHIFLKEAKDARETLI